MVDFADTCWTSRRTRGRNLILDQDDRLPCNERPELAELDIYENTFCDSTALAAGSKSDTVTQCAMCGGPLGAGGDNNEVGGGEADGDGGKIEVVAGLLDDNSVVRDFSAVGSIFPT